MAPKLQYLKDVKGRKDTAGMKLGPLINVSCEVTVNLPSQLHEERLGNLLIFLKQRTYVK